jgi:hypothetical protein
MVKKVAKKIVKKGTQLQRVVSEATKGEGKFKEAARTEPLSGTSYSDSPGFGTSNVGKKSVAAEESIVKASMSKTQKAKQTKAAKLETKEEKGTITAAEKKWLKNYNKTQEADTKAIQKSIKKTQQQKKSKAKGVSLAGSEKAGGRKATATSEYKNQKDFKGDKIKVDAYGKPTGNTITADGEIIGNPSDRMMEQAARNFIARNSTPKNRRIKAQVAELKRRSPKGELTEKTTDPKTGEVTGVLKSKVGSRNQSRTAKDMSGVTNPVKGQKKTFKQTGGRIKSKPRGVGAATRGFGKAMK